MDIHQKISIGIFGSLLIGTLAMYGTGGLSSSVIGSNALEIGADPCAGSFMTEYVQTYPNDKEKMIEIQRFIGRNCLRDVVESKKSYCEARSKQLETYSVLVKRYELCLHPAPTLPTKANIPR